MAVADPIARLVKELARLPGIGEKTAQRLAFHVLAAGPEYAQALAEAVIGVVRDVRCCSRCQTLTDTDPCGICTDTRRDPRILCVVEGVPDLVAIERTHEYKGRYHVLHGALSPLDGVGPADLKIRELLVRLETDPTDEVIVATNPDVEGEATALYLARLLKPTGVKVSRIAQGVPMGGDLEYADQVTLARAMAGRREL
ncbi:MAG: recombination mediator RecR [Deltaproteobacteria bacterium]